MNQEATENGKKVVETLNDTTLPPMLRVQGLNSLETEGYYKYAAEQGLHQALLRLLKEDVECAMERFTKKNPMENVVYLHWIVNTIFRGQRISRAGTSTFGKLDGGRIKSFIESDPEAFPTMWKAAVLVARIPLKRTTSPDVQLLIHHQARDVWAAFAMFFCNNRASRAALLVEDPVKCKAQAEWMLKELKPAFVERWNSPDELDQGSTVEAHMNTNCAILAGRVRNDAGVELNVEKWTGMKGVHRKMYREMGVPMGEATLKKGRALTTPESMAVISSNGGSGTLSPTEYQQRMRVPEPVKLSITGS
eukprot:CAMPEP_0198142046 /NCGR_PEP_ID=MMETSP1443-20131203/4949_1 /TAXON_ID=186043 /ORGANISM="Entomoneis sp., Strain CCMP2396" /LENGTH=306 /DNA_ID=CAMNT_0043804979 /DNA_START=50 /DNA_END=968 /DNA_ORIENTATION=-